jgi:hypothetical protein
MAPTLVAVSEHQGSGLASFSKAYENKKKRKKRKRKVKHGRAFIHWPYISTTEFIAAASTLYRM